MYVVFLSGLIASGKSAAARMLAEFGAKLIDLDAISHDLLKYNKPCIDAVCKEFGDDLRSDDGSINRDILASRVFCSPQKLERLEACELPCIFAEMKRQLQSIEQEEPESIVVVEVPLLHKAQSYFHLADERLVVRCPEELRCKRALERGMREDDFQARSALQLSDAELHKLATTTIDNMGTLSELRTKLKAWWYQRLAR